MKERIWRRRRSLGALFAALVIHVDHPFPVQDIGATKKMDQSQLHAARQVDNLVRKHIVETAAMAIDDMPVAAISAADRLSWANEAGVDIKFVDARLALICREVGSDDEHWSIPRFQMKAENATPGR